MLKKFSVRNYKGFKERIELDLTQKREYGYNDFLINNGIVNKAVIYGKNASGKSNLGYAIFDIVAHLTEKLHSRRNSSYLNANTTNAIADFEYTFLFSGRILKYAYGKRSDMDLVYEKLYFDGKLVFDFNLDLNQLISSSLDVTDKIQWESRYEKVSAVKFLFTTFKFEADNPIVGLKDFVNSMLWFRRCDTLNNSIGFTSLPGNIDSFIYEKKLVFKLQEFFKENGINEKVSVEMENGVPMLKVKYARHNMLFNDVASSGTKALLLIFYWREVAFKNASFVFMDEFDAFYHHELAASIVKLLFEQSDFQTIFTTHNLSLLSNIKYRPDIYYQIKDNQIKNFPDSTDRIIRQAHNLEKMYKAGVFED